LLPAIYNAEGHVNAVGVYLISTHVARAIPVC
jgi:hypothetical protein